jgi:hypothetical protein
MAETDRRHRRQRAPELGSEGRREGIQLCALDEEEEPMGAVLRASIRAMV